MWLDNGADNLRESRRRREQESRRMSVVNGAPPAPEGAFGRFREWVRRGISQFGVYLVAGVWAFATLLVFLVHLHVLPEKWQIFKTEDLPALGLVTALILV